MAQRHRTIGIASLAVGGMVFASAMAGRSHAPEERAPAVQIIGHDSHITKASFELIRDEASLAALWARHTGLEAGAAPPTRHSVPVVDFSRFMIIGAFNGTATNTDGLVASSVTTGDDAVRVRFETSSFQTASFGPEPDRGVTTTCYGIWIIDRSDKPLVIEEGVRQLKNEPIRWVEVSRFAGK
jgi:hypothetical protein